MESLRNTRSGPIGCVKAALRPPCEENTTVHGRNREKPKTKDILALRQDGGNIFFPEVWRRGGFYGKWSVVAPLAQNS